MLSLFILKNKCSGFLIFFSIKISPLSGIIKNTESHVMYLHCSQTNLEMTYNNYENILNSNLTFMALNLCNT